MITDEVLQFGFQLNYQILCQLLLGLCYFVNWFLSFFPLQKYFARSYLVVQHFIFFFDQLLMITPLYNSMSKPWVYSEDARMELSIPSKPQAAECHAYSITHWSPQAGECYAYSHSGSSDLKTDNTAG